MNSSAVPVFTVALKSVCVWAGRLWLWTAFKFHSPGTTFQPKFSVSLHVPRSNAMRKHELLVRSLEVAQASSAAYLDLIKEFADCGLED
ncbi:hypothetical protein MTR_8g044980 [Medicago truncatula]|uniref:Uncharacterized protein n=1 Tax=Medicago truncatula TaxID=3880 RepID=G7L7P6_MEDTR|nr:hypothetical protein MTR_8g044980 [Medicago truncatula]